MKIRKGAPGTIRTGVDFSEFEEFAQSMEEMERKAPGFIRDLLDEYSEEMVDDIKRFTPVDTGTLRDSWGVISSWMVPYKREMYSRYHKGVVKKTLFRRGGEPRRHGEGMSMWVVISNPQRYAEEVEYGGPTNEGRFMMHKGMAKAKAGFNKLYKARLQRFVKDVGVT